MDRKTIGHWLRAVLAVIGAFWIFGILADIAAGLVGLWDTPVAGCVAAFSVVLVSYLVVPSHRIWAAFATFGLGAVAAWKLIGRSDFPESYGALAYQPTYVPFLATLGGGVAALALALVIHRRRGSRELGA